MRIKNRARSFMQVRRSRSNSSSRSKRGVSPVIGVILMVAATIVIAGVVMGMLGGFGPPKAAATVTASASRTPGGNISVTYLGGPDHDAMVNTSASLQYTLTNSSSPSMSPANLMMPTVGNTTEISSNSDAGEDHLTVIVTLKDGTTQVILDTYV